MKALCILLFLLSPFILFSCEPDYLSAALDGEDVGDDETKDRCPSDPKKVEPGKCGCGVPDEDADKDGTPNCYDSCPTDALKVEPGDCGCGMPDNDTNHDGTVDCLDHCLADPDKDVPGFCGCGTPDIDADHDRAWDCLEECPTDPLKAEAGMCGCNRLDDGDADGAWDCEEGCPNDPLKSMPGECGCGQVDDRDADGAWDCEEGCLNDPRKSEPGVCGCGNPEEDVDQDGKPDCIDECPSDPDKLGPGQCGCGNADIDTDQDGTADCHDLCPNDPDKITPGQCGCGKRDMDVDSDGIADCLEHCPSGLSLGSAVQYSDYVTSRSTGTEYIDSCPNDQVVIGFRGFVQDQGTYEIHGRLQAVCGSVSILSAHGQCLVNTTETSSLPLRGTTGAIVWERMCPPNQFIMGFKARTGVDVDELVFRCAPLLISQDRSGTSISRGAFTDLARAGGVGGQPRPQADCPEGTIATQTKLQAEKYLRAIALGCKAPTLSN